MWLDDLYHALDPVALAAGPVVIRWYGLAYFFGFVCAAIAIRRTARRWGFSMSVDDLTTLMVGIAFGVIIGARLAYVIFYGDGYYLQNPLEVLVPVGGGIRGMSFHGGLVGAIAGGAIACRHLRWSIPTTCDLAVIGAPLGLFFGRCANFINGELWGKETSLPWGVMFWDTGGGHVYRHPSQLYEALLEGVLMFAILYLLSRAGHVPGHVPRALWVLPLPDRVRAPAGRTAWLPARHRLADHGPVPVAAPRGRGRRRRDLGASGPVSAGAPAGEGAPLVGTSCVTSRTR